MQLPHSYTMVVALASGGGCGWWPLIHAAELIGGHNSNVQAAECTIATVFGKMQEIKTASACTSGCSAGGVCPVDWYPTAADSCSVECGGIFEPFCALSSIVQFSACGHPRGAAQHVAERARMLF